MKRNCIMLLICIFISSHFIGCNLFKPKEKDWKPVTPQKKAVVHVVKYDGETLDIISKWYTGDTLNKNILAESNPSISLSELLPGDKIFIPNEILKNRSPDPGLKAQEIEDKNEWTKEKIIEKALTITSDKGPDGDFDD